MRVLYAALFVLFLLHNDFWLWNDTRIVAGLPVGLTYHVVYCLVTAVLLGLLVTRAWPYGDGLAADDNPAPNDVGEGLAPSRAVRGAELSREGASPSPTGSRKDGDTA